jgi:hypothetical protein
VGAWYWVGVSAGLGASFAVLVGGLVGYFRPFRGHLAVRALVLLWLGFLIGIAISSWKAGGWFDAVAGGVAASLVFLGAAQIVWGALRRGGTRGGTATLFAGAALIAAGVALIPAAGYLEAVALPALALRLRRTQPERYAGLRTLAKD